MAVAGLILTWIVLMFVGFPVALSLLLLCLGYMLLAGYGTSGLAAIMLDSIDNFPLLAMPLFILAACILNSAGVTRRLFDFSNRLVGHFTGGLGHVNVLASIFFSGMSGSAVADAGGLGKIEIQMMREAGYDDEFSGSITAASSIIGPIIPPSITMVIYGVIANASIGQLFMGGVLPGLLCGLVLMAQVYLIAKKRNYPVSQWLGWRSLLRSFRQSFFAILTPAIIIFGIFSGLFSPTEAAAITVGYSIFISAVIYRKLSWKIFYSNLCETVVTTSSIIIITMAVALLSQIIAREQITQSLTGVLLRYAANKYLFLLLVNLVFFVLGSFLPALILVLVMVPVLLPAVYGFGINPTHFGVMITLNIMVGSLTPPMGVALFVVSKAGGIPFQKLARAIWPWLIPLVLALLLVTYIPSLSTWLPSLMNKITGVT